MWFCESLKCQYNYWYWGVIMNKNCMEFIINLNCITFIAVFLHLHNNRTKNIRLLFIRIYFLHLNHDIQKIHNLMLFGQNE